MKKIFISLLLVTVFSANAMKDNSKTSKMVIVVPNYKNANWCQKNLDSISVETDLLRRMDDELALQNKRVTHVYYNPCQNSIIAQAYCTKNGQDLSVTVIKYLSCEELEVSASRSVLCNKKTGCFSESSPSDHMHVRCVADPSIVQQLITKIAEFESGMEKK
jgi:hypothetical protein